MTGGTHQVVRDPVLVKLNRGDYKTCLHIPPNWFYSVFIQWSFFNLVLTPIPKTILAWVKKECICPIWLKSQNSQDLSQSEQRFFA